jgi:hypothetical protein
MSDLVLFLMEHLPEDEWEQLDEHREKQFDYEYVPEGRADLWTAQAPGCAVCTQNPSKHGGIGYGTSWIEAWPCRHLCALALPYADQPGYHPWWQERLTLGAQVIWRGTNS